MPDVTKGSRNRGFWLTHPISLFAAVGLLGPWIAPAPGASLLAGVILGLWVTVLGARSLLQTQLHDPSRRGPLEPATALKAGMATAGMMTLLVVGIANLATALGIIMPRTVVMGLWAALSLSTIGRASRTDMQSGWLAGTGILGTWGAFLGTISFGSLIHQGLMVPFWKWPILLFPALLILMVKNLHTALGSRSRERSEASLKAVSCAGMIWASFALCRVLRTGSLLSVPTLFNVGLPLAALFLPIYLNRDRIRALAIGSDPPGSTAALPDAGTQDTT